jgi:hypothetical protein
MVAPIDVYVLLDTEAEPRERWPPQHHRLSSDAMFGRWFGRMGAWPNACGSPARAGLGWLV